MLLSHLFIDDHFPQVSLLVLLTFLNRKQKVKLSTNKISKDSLVILAIDQSIEPMLYFLILKQFKVSCLCLCYFVVVHFDSPSLYLKLLENIIENLNSDAKNLLKLCC